jgi:hypothetical protein
MSSKNSDPPGVRRPRWVMVRWNTRRRAQRGLSTRHTVARVVLLLALWLAALSPEGGIVPKRRQAATRPEPASLVRRITVLKEGGARLDWVDDKIAFDMLGPDHFFGVYSMKPDGTDVRCLTCNHPDLPRRNIGQPAWHPSGRYLVFQVEKAQHQRVLMSHQVTPGAGRLNDLWILDLDTNRATIVREVANAAGEGTLHPHFSSDGRRLSWSEMQGKGKGWALMVADFLVDRGKPRLENVHAYVPGGRGFYENHGFSPDGTRLIFTSEFEAKLHIPDIYLMDLRTEKLTRLTHQGYNEHAIYSPDGRHIAWMTTVGNRGGIGGAGTDYWIMDSDGGNKRRLTHFNEKGYPEYVGRKVIVADLSWRPDGTAFAGYYREGGLIENERVPTRIVLVELKLP